MARWLASALAVVSLIGCGGDSTDDGAPVESDGVRIASFDFAEAELLAELYAQVLEERAVPVVRLGAAGPREIVAPALEGGLIDLVPEYLGTASGYFGATGDDLDALIGALAPRGLTALTPAPAEDVNVFVVTAEFAAERGVSRLSDLAALPAGLRVGGPVECPERPLCLIGLRDSYGLVSVDFVPQRTLVVTAEALRRDEIDLGVMFSTAAALSDEDFVVLEDDRRLQPAENVVPVVRVAALDRWGSDVRDALDEFSAALTTDELRALNRRVADGEEVAAVAGAWLEDSMRAG